MATVTNSYRKWKPLKVGAGGWLVGFDQHSDGTLVCRTDTYGAWLYNSGTGIWSQLVTTSSMPAGDQILGNATGVYELKIAPSDSNVMYMLYIGRLYRTANKGTTWTLCAGWTPVSNLAANAASHARYTGERLCIDPIDEDVVYIGTMDDGLWRTFDGGATCTLIEDVPVGSGSAGGTEPGITGIVIDPSADAVSGRSGTIWASSYGEGYYRSTNGGIDWTEPAGFTPATCVMHSAFTSTGILYCTEYFGDGSPNTVWRNTAGTWEELDHTNVTTNANRLWHTIAIDPADEDRIVLGTSGGALLESLDGGDTFSALRTSTSNESSDDIPWLENGWGTPGNPAPYMSSGDMRFSKKSGETNRMLFSEGIGFWNATLASGFTTIPWVAMSNGIEQLVANEVVTLPDGRLFLASWDRPIFEITDPDTYPSSYIFKDKYLNHCMALDYVRADPDIMGAAMYYSDSIFTTDGWATKTEVVPPTESAFTTGGGAGELVPFSATKFVWIQANDQGIWYSADACSTWTRVSLTGMTDDADGWAGLNHAYYFRRRILAPDGLTDGMGYIWHATAGIYKTTNHGEDWTRVFTGQLTAFANSNAKLRCTPGVEGHLWATIGDQSGGVSGVFKRSEDGGVNWATIADVLEVKDFGFGAIAPGASYPRLWIIGWVNGTAQANFGIYYSDDEGVTWTRVLDGAFPLNSLDSLVAIDGDKVDVSKAYVGFIGSGYTYTDGRLAGEPEGYMRLRLNNN